MPAGEQGADDGTATPSVTRIKSVCIPCVDRDIPAALEKIFALWSDPRFLPVAATAREAEHRPVLLVVVNRSSTRTIEVVQALFDTYKTLASVFSKVRVCDAGLTGDRDLYHRDTQDLMGAHGNKAGPNFLFQAAMGFAADYGGFTVQLEVDCIALRAGWLSDLEAIIETNRRAWVIGAMYLGCQGLDRAVQFHINGNALYHVGDPAFMAFLNEVWMPRVFSLVGRMPGIAYDCWWSVEKARASSMARNTSWRLVQKYDHRIRHDPFIINLVAVGEDIAEFIDILAEQRASGIEPILLHGSSIRLVIDKVLEDKKLSVEDAIRALAVEAATNAEAAGDDQAVAGFADGDRDGAETGTGGKAAVHAFHPTRCAIPEPMPAFAEGSIRQTSPRVAASGQNGAAGHTAPVASGVLTFATLGAVGNAPEFGGAARASAQLSSAPTSPFWGEVSPRLMPQPLLGPLPAPGHNGNASAAAQACAITPAHGATIVLRDGFHPVEGPYPDYDGQRVVWTSGQSFVLRGQNVTGGLTLPFRVVGEREPNFDIVAQDGVTSISQEWSTMHQRGLLRIDTDDDRNAFELRLDADCEVIRVDGRSLCLMFIETDVMFRR